MGAGSQHANTEHYARGAYLDGGKSYRLFMRKIRVMLSYIPHG